jgi:hypothetical protein
MAKIKKEQVFEWFAAVWRFARVFLAAFVGSISVDKLLNGSQDVKLELIESAVIAGISALFKLWRDNSNSTVAKNFPL